MKFPIIISALAIYTLASCGKKQEPETRSAGFSLSDSMQHLITIDTIKYCPINNELSLSGEVNFNENTTVKIFPRSSGQVLDCQVSPGDKVTKGQVLATVKSADVAGNYSDLSSANADIAIAKRQMENTEALYKNGISSEKEYTEARQNYEKALAVKTKIQSEISINGGARTSASGEYRITAPIDGYIVEKKTATGAFIRPDMGDNLFTIADLKKVWVYANVYETDIAKVKTGYEVKVAPVAYPDRVYTGTIDQVSQTLDPQSKAMRIRIVLDNKDMMLKPDMFTKVTVSNEEPETAVCLPTAALVSQDGKTYVVVCKGKSDLRIEEVTVLKTINEQTYISSGLAPGTPVITRYQNLIFNQLMNE